MKKNLARIWGVGLVVVLLTSLLFSAVPVAAAELSWDTYGLPGTANNVLVSNVEIGDIAVAADGVTVYVAGVTDVDADGAGEIYKSTNGGKTFSAIEPLSTIASVKLVAVAPDDANIIVVAGDAGNLEVAVTTNGGSSWSSLGTVTSVAGPAVATALFDLAIGPLSAGSRFVALAGNSAAGPGVYYLGIGATVPGWKNAVLDFTTPLLDIDPVTAGNQMPATANFKAVAFSPSFVSDQTAVAISADPTAVTGGMRLHILSFNQQKWDAVAGFTSYPVMVKLTVGAFTLNSAALALDPNYLGGDDSLRNVFIAADALDVAAQVGGIFRTKDTSVASLLTTTAINSIAYNGSVLVAGATASNAIRRSEDPMATSPTIGSAGGLKRPGLDTTAVNTKVAFAGTTVVAGGSVAAAANDGTGFGISTDLGKSFVEYSLIDSTIPNVVDFQFAKDGSKSYALTNNGAGVTSLWRKTDAWARIWQNATAPTIKYLVRVAPDNKDVVFITDSGGGAATNMWYTDNGGEVKWFPRSSRYGVQDLAVESADIAYVAINGAGTVSKTTNKGFTWGDAKSASLAGGTTNSITSIGTDKLLVGSTAGAVSYSADGNANWTKIDKILTGAGNTVATASGLASGDFVYAAQSVGATRVERWTIGTSTSWKNMGAPVPVNTATETYGATGIALSEGALYVIINDNTGAALDSQLLRTISPTADAPGWSTVIIGGAGSLVDTDLAPTDLAVVKGSTTLYTVDTAPASDVIYTFMDTLAIAKPALAGPADAGAVKVNPISGNTFTISFSWNRPHASTSVATLYDLQVAEDSGFTVQVYSATAPAAATTNAVVSATPALTLNPGTKYYWRVRVNAANPVQSPWSDVRSFTIEEAKVTPPVTITSAPPAPIITLPAPVINLPPPTTITIPPAPVITIPPPPAPPAPIAPAYIWAVVIIGAVLVIAVIILIVRTRRPV